MTRAFFADGFSPLCFLSGHMNANIKYSVIRFLLFNVHVQKPTYGKSTTDKSHRQKSTRHSNRASSMSVSGFKLRVSGSESGFILVQFRIYLFLVRVRTCILSSKSGFGSVLGTGFYSFLVRVWVRILSNMSGSGSAS